MKDGGEKAPNEMIRSPFEDGIHQYAKAVNEGRDDEAQAMVMNLLLLAAQDAQEKPSLDIIWSQLAGECAELGNWPAAVDALQKVLDYAREQPHPGYPVKACLDLARLHQMLGRPEPARSLIESALEAARKSEIPTLLSMALDAKLQAVLHAARPTTAPVHSESAPETTGGTMLPRVLSLPSDLHCALDEIARESRDGLKGIPDQRVFDHTKSRFYLIQAGCAAALGDAVAAEKLLELALARMTRVPALGVGQPGYDSRASQVRAAIFLARKDPAAAVAVTREAVEQERIIDAQPHRHGIPSRYRLAMTLRSFACFLELVGQLAEASAARAEAATVLTEMKLPAS